MHFVADMFVFVCYKDAIFIIAFYMGDVGGLIQSVLSFFGLVYVFCFRRNNLLLLDLPVSFGWCILCAWPHVKYISSGMIAVFMFSFDVCTHTVG